MTVIGPVPLPFFHFRVARQMWVGISQWPQVEAWVAGGLLTVMELTADQRMVHLTDAGRAELDKFQGSTG
jgi:hypothetical protein